MTQIYLETAIDFYSKEIGDKEAAECLACASKEVSRGEADYNGMEVQDYLEKRYIFYLIRSYQAVLFRRGE